MDVDVIPPAALTGVQRSAWEEWLQASSLRRTPFLHPDVARVVADAEPRTRVLVVRHRGRDVAYLPVELRGRHAWPVAAMLNDGDGVVVRPGTGMDITAVLRRAGVWTLHWAHRDLEPGSPLAAHDRETRPAARVSLADGLDAWEQDKASVLRQADRKARKLAREVGDVRLTLDAGPALAEEVVRQKQSQAAAAGLAQTLEDAQAARMIRAMAGLPADSPVRSMISVLHAGDVPVATCWSLAMGGLLVVSVPTVDLAHGSHSPGLVMQVEMIRAMPAAGLDEADLGLGLNQTKERLMTHTVPLGVGTAFSGPLAAQGWRARRTAIDGARRVLSRLRG